MHLGRTINALLSIIMPVYNAEKYLRQAIESIVNQSYEEWELHICDDKSTDRSWEVIKQFDAIDDRIFIYQNDENQGKVKSVNSLLEKCKGEYLTIHDADDWSEEMRFEKQIKKLIDFDYKLVGCGYNEIDKFGTITGVDSLNLEYETIKENIYKQSQFHGPTIVFKKSILEEVGGLYRTPFIVAEDTDFCERVAEKYLACNLFDKLYNYRIVEDSLTKNIKYYSAKRYALEDLFTFLRDERKVHGYDSLWNNEFPTVIKEKISQWEKKWTDNIELVYWDGISRSLYFGFKTSALKLNLLWIKKKPFHFKPWKNFFSLILKNN